MGAPSALLLSPITAAAACCAISAAYVGSLYAWADHPGGRQHPAVIVRRMLSVACVSSVAWLPAAACNAAAQAAADAARAGAAAPPPRPPAPTALLLGLRPDGAAAAAALPLAALALLFLGPLLHLLTSRSAREGHPLRSAVAAAVNGGPGAAAVRLQLLRDLAVAPAAEEWVFRACLVPLLWLTGVPRGLIVLVTPLFFGAAHLHHLRELTVVHGVSMGDALPVVVFQFVYTAVFGCLATWLFLSTGHALAPALAHAACNAMGVPKLGAMGAARVGGVRVLLWATAGGAALFLWLSGPLLDPRRFGNAVYA